MAVPKTVRTFALDGSKTFTIPFEYLARKFVVVTLIGATRRELILNSEYRFVTSTSITTTRTWGPSDGFDLIEIRRLTSASERLVDFADGSILRAYDLNISSVQSLHIAEEARDLTADTIGVNNDGNLDARARRIVNLADAVNDGDAVSLRQQKTWGGSALNQAQASAQSAQASAQSAAQSAQSDVQATSQRNEATRQAQLSAASAVVSAERADDSARARDRSKQWAEAGDGVQVDPGMYSSKAWSNTSKLQAERSQASAVASEQSRANSQASNLSSVAAAERSAADAARAKAEADKLGNMNSLGAALSGVSGQTVLWKGEQISIDGGFQARSGVDGEANFSMSASNGTDPIRLVRTPDRRIHLFGNRSGDGDRMIWAEDGVTVSKNLTVSGSTGLQGLSATSGAFSGALNAQSLTLTRGAFVRQTVEISPQDSNGENTHLWFRDIDRSTERALLYADSARQLHIRANQGAGGEAVVRADNSWAFGAPIEVQRSPGRMSTFFSPYAQLDGSMYGNTCLQLQGTGGGVAGLGFHNAGRVASTLWLNNDNQFWQMVNDGTNKLMLTNHNLMGQIAGNMGADTLGSLAFLSNAGGAAGPNSNVGGGSLKWSSHNQVLNQTVNGTWRCLGHANVNGSTLWLRIA